MAIEAALSRIQGDGDWFGPSGDDVVEWEPMFSIKKKKWHPAFGAKKRAPCCEAHKEEMN
jgi:hypothetical protein